MIFAIDFDGTFNSRPELFTDLVKAIIRGNRDKVILITNRENDSANRSFVFGTLPHALPAIDVIFCGKRSKREVARKCGYEVDIWIDDNPVLVDFGMQGYDELYKC